MGLNLGMVIGWLGFLCWASGVFDFCLWGFGLTGFLVWGSWCDVFLRGGVDRSDLFSLGSRVGWIFGLGVPWVGLWPLGVSGGLDFCRWGLGWVGILFEVSGGSGFLSLGTLGWIGFFVCGVSAA